MAETSGRALLGRAEENALELVRALARHSPQGRIEETGRALLTATGLPMPAFNLALVQRMPDDPAALAGQLQQFYGGVAAPALLLAATGAIGAAIGPAVEAAGWVAEEKPSLMILAPLPPPPPPPPGLAIRIVDDAATLRRYNDTFAAGFGVPRDAWTFFDDPRLLAIPDLTLYLGFADGLPVATGLRFTSHRVAGIYNIGKLPAYRQRGLGEAMTWRAIRDGRDEACLASALQPSSMGRPIYERMGYRLAAAYPAWLRG